MEYQLDAKVYGGKTVDLYYQPENGKAELIDQLTVSEDGMVAIPLEHCSVYFLTPTSDSSSSSKVEESASSKPASSSESASQDATSASDVETAAEAGSSAGFPWVAAGLAAVVAIALGGVGAIAIRRNNQGE